MKKYKNIDEFLADKDLTREELISLIARSALQLATDCAKNFCEAPEITEQVSLPLYFLKQMLDEVE